MERNQRMKNGLGVGAIILSLAVAASGCTSNPGDTQGSLHKYSGPTKVKTLEQTRAKEKSSPSVVPVKVIQNSDYVSLADVARATGFHAKWLNDGQYGIGDNDVVWKFKPGNSTAQVASKQVKLPAPTIKESNRLYAPVSALKSLFGDVASFRADSKSVSFYPVTDEIIRNGIKAQAVNPHSQGTGRGVHELDVGPNEAYRVENAEGLGTGIGQTNANAGSMDGGTASNNGQAAGQNGSTAEGDDLIAAAKHYLGVKYDFGAGDYADTGKFDCSSFVQLLYAKYGITMPRAARDQAELGRKVSRDELKKGDLLFFYVPGRFKTDDIVGHVTIYMGDGNMIHASPQPEDGVQITPIDKPYWVRTFLYAKRVLPD